MMKRESNTPLLGGRIRRTAIFAGLALTLGACGSASDFDWDLRPSDRFSTSAAARQATAARPQPDARGVISYPGYQVVVAQRGEQVSEIAQRLGLSSAALARHNAIETNTVLRGGELLVLPSRIDGAISDPGAITATPLAPVAPAGPEPLQHTVRRGETAFSIARLYDVTPRSLSDWNGLDSTMNVREGQILMIPVAQMQTAAAGTTLTQASPTGAPLSAPGVAAAQATSPAALSPTITGPTITGPTITGPTPSTALPGQGSVTPEPPSAAQPLPATSPSPAGQTASASTPAPAPVANLSAQRTEGPRLAMPVQGRIIRAYARGRNDGIGIGAPVGTEVRAAAAGTVAAITRDTDQVPILVVRHQNNLLTVYANIDDIRVERGATITRGQVLATVRQGEPSFLHFEVREGFESVDPMPYLQ